MAKEVTFSILDGPTRKNFLDGFNKAYPHFEGMQLCEFILQDENGAKSTMYVRLETITHYGTSSITFTFKGILNETVFDGPAYAVSGGRPCAGYYDTCIRSGWIKAESQQD